MEASMKVLQIVEPHKVEWRDAPIPQPGAHEVLVKVAAVTTCPHWDLHILSGKPMFPGTPNEYPYTPGQPGHEMTGEVAAVGVGVTELAVGDHVVAWRDTGKVRQGCYAQYVPFETENLLKIPADTPPAAVASLELSMCVQVAFDQFAEVGGVAGKRFAVSGLGSAGLIALQMAQAYGASEVIAIDPMLKRHALAKELGADGVVVPDANVLPPNTTGALAFGMAIDCTGIAASVEFLMERTHGSLLVFGTLRDPVSFGFAQWRSGINLMGYGFHNRGAAEKALKLVLDGKVRLEPLATKELPLSRYMDGVELLSNTEAIKVRFLPWA